MRRLSRTALFLMLVAAGCTVMRPIGMTPEEVQLTLRDGDSVHVGNRLNLLLKDGRVLEVTVDAIETDALRVREGGREDQLVIPFEEIVRVEKWDWDKGKTGKVVAGTALILYVLPYVILIAVGGPFGRE